MKYSNILLGAPLIYKKLLSFIALFYMSHDEICLLQPQQTIAALIIHNTLLVQSPYCFLYDRVKHK